eukprot:5656001-Alexandrium_andersonii.AAC.2
MGDQAGMWQCYGLELVRKHLRIRFFRNSAIPGEDTARLKLRCTRGLFAFPGPELLPLSGQQLAKLKLLLAPFPGSKSLGVRGRECSPTHCSVVGLAYIAERPPQPTDQQPHRPPLGSAGLASPQRAVHLAACPVVASSFRTRLPARSQC